MALSSTPARSPASSSNSSNARRTHNPVYGRCGWRASWATCHAPDRRRFCARQFYAFSRRRWTSSILSSSHHGGLPPVRKIDYRFSSLLSAVQIKGNSDSWYSVLVKLQFHLLEPMRPRESFGSVSSEGTPRCAKTRPRAYHPPSDGRDVLEWSPSGGVPGRAGRF